MFLSFYLHLKSDNKNLINFYTLTLKNLFKFSNVNLSNCVNLPVKVSKFTVLRSPHVYKKSREQFEYKIYSSLFIISFKYDDFLYRKIFFLLTFLKYQLPTGISLKITKNIKL